MRDQPNSGLNRRQVARQARLLASLKGHLGKLCRELQLQRKCLDQVDDFAQFLREQNASIATNLSLNRIESPSSPIDADEQQQSAIAEPLNDHRQHQYNLDEQFRIHHQKFFRQHHYFSSKLAKFRHTDYVSSLYDVLFDLYENCGLLYVGSGQNKTLEQSDSMLAGGSQANHQCTKLDDRINPCDSFNLANHSPSSPPPPPPPPISSSPPRVAKTTKRTTRQRTKGSKKVINNSSSGKDRRKSGKGKRDGLARVVAVRKKKAEKGNFECPMATCSKMYKFKDNLLKHLVQHVEVKTEVLEAEQLRLPKRKRKKRVDVVTRSKRARAAEGSSGGEVWRCEFEGCSYKAPYRSALDLHKVKHSNERPFKCAQCDKSFKQIYALKMHEMMHSGQQFECPFTGCNAVYSWVYSLKKHMRIHTNQAPVHRCEWPACEYQTHRPDLLRKHMTRHTGERLFQCTWAGCGKSFKTRSGLYDHVLMHKNERKQVCNWPGCNYRCNLPGNLRKHVAIHEKKLVRLDPLSDSPEHQHQRQQNEQQHRTLLHQHYATETMPGQTDSLQHASILTSPHLQ